MHFQIDESEFPEQICLGIVVSFFPQPSREDVSDRLKPSAGALLGLDECVV
jgi:hypothetical protein